VSGVAFGGSGAADGEKAGDNQPWKAAAANRASGAHRPPAEERGRGYLRRQKARKGKRRADSPLSEVSERALKCFSMKKMMSR
jgi:hypothetical protein